MTSNNQTAKKRVAILVEKDFEDSEFQIPRTALSQAGAEVVVLGSRMNETYKGKQGNVSVEPDATTTESRVETFDAVIIPGGNAPDRMRMNPNTVRFVQDAIAQGKLVAAVCHGPQVLIEGDVLQGRRATGVKAIRKDMQNAGANYVDEPLVVDTNLITSRQPGDLPIFTTAILSRLGLRLEEMELPDETLQDVEWWKLGEAWGGSSQKDIVGGINTALGGEHYGLESFERYSEKTPNSELRRVFNDISVSKQDHIEMLRIRLAQLGEQESWVAAGGETYAALKGWLQTDNSDVELLRRALGDLQTGVVDLYNLSIKFTDPTTTALFQKIEVDLAAQERQVAELYHAHVGLAVKPSQPTTDTAVS